MKESFERVRESGDVLATSGSKTYALDLFFLKKENLLLMMIVENYFPQRYLLLISTDE